MNTSKRALPVALVAVIVLAVITKWALIAGAVILLAFLLAIFGLAGKC